MPKSDYFVEIGDYFRKKRILQGLTQEEVSSYLGYSTKQIISNWERGLCSPPLNQMGALIKLYKLNGSEVLELFMDVHSRNLCAHFGIKGRAKRVS